MANYVRNFGNFSGEKEDVVVDYIRYYWIADRGPIRSRDLYDAIRDTIKNKTAAVTLASNLQLRAYDYAALVLPSHEKWAEYGTPSGSKLKRWGFLAQSK